MNISSSTLFLRSLSVVLIAFATYKLLDSVFINKQEIVTIAFLGSKVDEDYFGSVGFKEVLEERSNGAFTVEIFPNGQLCGNEQECIENLRSGVLDIHMTTFAVLGNFYPPALALDLPYNIANDQEAECLFSGPVFNRLQKEVLDNGSGLRLMTISNTGGWRSFANRKHPIKQYEDFAELKIRIVPSILHKIFTQELGASPTPIPWSELYTATSTGVVDGTNNSITDIVNTKLHDSLNYYSIDKNAYMGALWWFSEKKWNRLSLEAQGWIKEAFETLREITLRLPKEQEAEALAVFKEAGGEVNVIESTERQRIIDKTSPTMRRWYSDKYGDEWLKILDEGLKLCRS